MRLFYLILQTGSDELSISAGNKPGHAVWPSVGKAKTNNYGIRTGGIWVGKTNLFPFCYKRDDEDASFSLWEYDVGSRDDFLGSFMVRPNEIGKRMSQLVVGVVEKSAYIIEYDVNPEDDEGSEMYLKIKNSPMDKSPMFKMLFGG